MDKIEKVARQILNAFKDSTIECTTEDAFASDSDCEMDDNLVIGDDFHRQEWLVEYKVHGGTHDEVMETLVSVFGQPNRKVRRQDLKLDVNNWDVGPVHVVQVQDGVTLIQRYQKR